MPTPLLLGEPKYERMTRERVFEVANLREDGKDALAQVSVIVNQLMKEKFTGPIVINCSEGGICNIVITQSLKIPKNNS